MPIVPRETCNYLRQTNLRKRTFLFIVSIINISKQSLAMESRIQNIKTNSNHGEYNSEHFQTNSSHEENPLTAHLTAA